MNETIIEIISTGDGENIYDNYDDFLGECTVTKTNSTDEGFDIKFSIIDDDDEDDEDNVTKTFEVRTIADLYEAARIVEKFTWNPYKAIERLD